jgi:hypothetical protein
MKDARLGIVLSNTSLNTSKAKPGAFCSNAPGYLSVVPGQKTAHAMITSASDGTGENGDRASAEQKPASPTWPWQSS